MQSVATVLPPTGSPKSDRMVCVVIFFQLSFSRSLPACFSFDWSCACAATRQPGSGALPHGAWHAPAMSAWPAGQLEQSVAAGPVHVVHEGSHAEQTASLLAVHIVLGKKPVPQVVQLSQLVWPCMSWNVPAAQPGHDDEPTVPLAVPTGHWLQTVEPGDEEKLPAVHDEHVVEPDPDWNVPAAHDEHDELPLTLLNVPAVHEVQPVDPMPGAAVPALQLEHDV